MKLSFLITAPFVALAVPAVAQQAGSQYQSSEPWSTGRQIMSFSESNQGRDYKSTSIDRRNSARFRAAKIARKAREQAERDARRANRG